MNVRLLLPSSLLAISLTAGCHGDPPTTEVRDPKPAPTSADAIADAPLSGTVRGRPFAMKTARYVVDRRPGRERIEIHLSAGEVQSPCEDDPAAHATDVWLRRVGSAQPKVETVRVDPAEPSSWEVHYEAYEGGQWIGSGRTSALVVIRDVRVDGLLVGDLSVCFGDASGSCVSGSFQARECPIRIDAPVRGRPALERLPDSMALPAADAGADGG